MSAGFYQVTCDIRTLAHLRIFILRYTNVLIIIIIIIIITAAVSALLSVYIVIKFRV